MHQESKNEFRAVKQRAPQLRGVTSQPRTLRRPHR
eukprot:COSAG06_NODE_63716_length_261_cov_1.209877_1_plen_34_part_10